MEILAYNESKIDTRQRNLTGYILFFISTFALLVVNAHVQGGMVGDLSFMCPEFIQSVLAGLAASGALTSALRLITKAAFEKLNNGLRKGTNNAKGPLKTENNVVSSNLDSSLSFYAASEGSKTVSADLAAGGIQTEATQGDLVANRSIDD
ncbi:hypothetical protein HYC85_006493 [Camellia sinensis]|uniref:Uncharacterized protein n=1 Tax=Camellia sinensis TaxID=4442 RepID=A0A7J7HMF2_CAMSI|nr:hypothetical protein HYC85_006493 [Camellia sinensis]